MDSYLAELRRVVEVLIEHGADVGARMRVSQSGHYQELLRLRTVRSQPDEGDTFDQRAKG